MKIIFTKIQNNHNRLRDNVIKGETDQLPIVGKQFVMRAPPRDIKIGFRHVNTSPVTKIISDVQHELSNHARKITFKTESGSEYSVEVII